ncbi:LytR/AlgR family response regulator transcription factor [Diplocloster modestus]|uniref:Stage 0 sporulation protein A homolog n=1 Tax=Diplocloster modestus TaxID=2850322 RepID=A0ABS6KCX7_9FIRM|nr:LytTR family DNA-binding domain-containing protein [Diplocloster modestus]MBU9728370.1 LytTR family DNA-binding domain-containing protein [Diplocloster modestus]
MVYRIAVCDDSEIHNMEILKLIKEFSLGKDIKTQIDIFHDGLEFISAAMQVKYDVALLDVDMPRMNGIGAAKIVRKKDPNLVIIFVTNYEGFTYDACEVEAIGYILKPVQKDKLFRIMGRAYSIVHDIRTSHKENLITITTQYENVQIDMNKIVRLSKFRNTIQILMVSGKEYIWYQTMKYAQQILDERYFVEVYRGIIVNTRFIKNIADEWIELEFNKQRENVPVSKRKSAEVKKLYYKRKAYI